MAFQLKPDRKATENKTIRFPLELINKIDEAIASGDGVARTDGKGEVADTLHQHGEQPFTALQGGL